MILHSPAITLVVILIAVVVIPALLAGGISLLRNHDDNGLIYEYQNPRNYKRH